MDPAGEFASSSPGGLFSASDAADRGIDEGVLRRAVQRGRVRLRRGAYAGTSRWSAKRRQRSVTACVCSPLNRTPPGSVLPRVRGGPGDFRSSARGRSRSRSPSKRRRAAGWARRGATGDAGGDRRRARRRPAHARQPDRGGRRADVTVRVGPRRGRRCPPAGTDDDREAPRVDPRRARTSARRASGAPRGRARVASRRSRRGSRSAEDAVVEALPVPVLQQSLRDRDGEIGRVDFWWRDHGLVGEFDGRLKYHVGCARRPGGRGAAVGREATRAVCAGGGRPGRPGGPGTWRWIATASPTTWLATACARHDAADPTPVGEQDAGGCPARGSPAARDAGRSTPKRSSAVAAAGAFDDFGRARPAGAGAGR